jgi:ADP-heptose:LPS heptosyltransferase
MKLDAKQSEYFNTIKPVYYFYRRQAVKIFFKIVDSIGFYFFTPGLRIVKPVAKILLVNLGGAGDLIISEPLLSALADFSGGKVDLLCAPHREDVLLDHPSLGKIWNCRPSWLEGKKKFLGSLPGLWRLSWVLRREKYSLAVDVKGDPLVILLLWFLGIKKIIGFSNGGLGFLLTHPFSQPDKQYRHKIDLVLTVALSENFENYNRPPHLSVAAGFSIPLQESSRARVAVHLGASVQARRWPLENWVELLSALSGKYDIVIIGESKDADDLFSAAPELCQKCYNLSGRTWRETAQIIKQSAVFIGANSGPAHLAAALGRPVISIFSAANDPLVWAPPGADVLVADPVCANCELIYCSHQSCLRTITPPMVISHLTEMENLKK